MAVTSIEFFVTKKIESHVQSLERPSCLWLIHHLNLGFCSMGHSIQENRTASTYAPQLLIKNLSVEEKSSSLTSAATLQHFVTPRSSSSSPSQHLFPGELDHSQLMPFNRKYKSQLTHDHDYRPILEDLLRWHEAELENIGQHQLPDPPIENPEKHDDNSDEAIEVVRQRRSIADLVGRAHERRNEH
jgi:hypothetical protein